MKGAALPSMIGTSGELSSTITLSMPMLTSAASRCSTVSTDTSSRASPVASWMPARLCTVAGTSWWPISVRRNLMPKSGGAGFRDSVTLLPECRPIPTHEI
jgi:hypothetical protein